MTKYDCEWGELADGTEVLYRDAPEQHVRCVVTQGGAAVVPVSLVEEWPERCTCGLTGCCFTNRQLYRFREKIATSETFKPHPSNVCFLH